MESQVVVAVPLKIGEVAGRSGLTVKTIRFYCDEGVIQPISRSEGGYRLFGEEVFAELTLIRTLKAMDIPLQDVTRILESRRSGICTRSSMACSAAGKTAVAANPQRLDVPYQSRNHCAIWSISRLCTRTMAASSSRSSGCWVLPWAWDAIITPMR